MVLFLRRINIFIVNESLFCYQIDYRQFSFEFFYFCPLQGHILNDINDHNLSVNNFHFKRSF